MDIVLIGGLWLDGSSAWEKVIAELEVLGHRGVPVVLPGQGDGNASATLAGRASNRMQRIATLREALGLSSPRRQRQQQFRQTARIVARHVVFNQQARADGFDSELANRIEVRHNRRGAFGRITL